MHKVFFECTKRPDLHQELFSDVIHFKNYFERAQNGSRQETEHC